MMNRFIFAILLLLPLAAVQADEAKGGYTFLLPVNEPKQIGLEITIPSNYRPLQPMEEWEKSPIIEFILNNEDSDQWSEIITITKVVGRGMPADYLIAAIQKGITNDVKEAKTLNESSQKEEGYNASFLTLGYDLNGKREVLEARYYSGPYDLSGAQYTVRSSGADKDPESIKKINDFFNEHVKVISTAPVEAKSS